MTNWKLTTKPEDNVFIQKQSEKHSLSELQEAEMWEMGTEHRKLCWEVQNGKGRKTGGC